MAFPPNDCHVSHVTLKVKFRELGKFCGASGTNLSLVGEQLDPGETGTRNKTQLVLTN